MNNRTYRRIK